ncbi:putative BRCT domain superfamily protein [Helianthus annuus]|uniref:BRCT domain superfamily protein n=1 Tax=Helianthus annuus TaxID=4232 RepID=A0A9K3P1M8_HELAN|nr:putative BRCT domain superfamily protein [Helianthus annuus]
MAELLMSVLLKFVNGGAVNVGKYGPNCTHVILDKLVWVLKFSYVVPNNWVSACSGLLCFISKPHFLF